MARMRGSIKKATKPVKEHSSFATAVRKSESSMPTEKKESKGIVPHDHDKILENKGPINEASIKRMTHGKDTPTMNKAETSKTRKGKTKVESKGINLTAEASLLHKMKDIEKLANSISNKSVESPPIVHVSNVEKEEESRDIDECMRRIDNLVEGEIIASKKASAIEEEVVVEEKDICVEVVKEKAEEENIETKATEKESVEYIVNTLATVISIGPLKVIPPIQEAADDARAEPEPKERSESRAKPKEKKRKCSKDKKYKKEEKKRRKKKYCAATLMAKEN
ncbi:uncharacterized protein [Gossypium hirsutum]|uniref:Uncharacterized protein n=1 Tax=Gossypium hirsutum TaxID=3635 RepID=A0A1U8PNC6_GOSHI|nr:uncharacterized protein LOC107960917 [Gossypium hirsutum]